MLYFSIWWFRSINAIMRLDKLKTILEFSMCSFSERRGLAKAKLIKMLQRVWPQPSTVNIVECIYILSWAQEILVVPNCSNDHLLTLQRWTFLIFLVKHKVLLLNNLMRLNCSSILRKSFRISISPSVTNFYNWLNSLSKIITSSEINTLQN